nr:hypothetical protein [Tanacetum cinerariifolium]
YHSYFPIQSFLISLIMDGGDEVSNLWVTFTSEKIAITFDERVHFVEDNSGYLPGPVPYNGGVKIEEVYDDASIEYQSWVPQITPTVVEPHGGMRLPLYPVLTTIASWYPLILVITMDLWELQTMFLVLRSITALYL